MKTRLIVAFILLIITEFAFSCEEKIEVNDCVPDNEHSWNPSNSSTTTRLNRFYELSELIEGEFKRNNYPTAKALIKEYLELAEIYSGNWNYGNAIHDGNRILGLISVEEGDLDGAVLFLLKAGESPGSPQLDSFGPELDLANILLKSGKKEEVVVYLNSVKKFWDMDNGVVITWINEISNGESPELNRFGSIQMTLFQKMVMWLGMAWLLLVAVGLYLFKRKSGLSALKFIPLAIILGYVVMYLSNYIYSALIFILINVIPESVLAVTLFVIIALIQFGLPLLSAIWLSKYRKLAVG